MLCLDGIGRESERVELKGEKKKKNINFAYDTEDQQRTERVSPEYVEVCCHLNYLASFGSSIATLNLTEHGCVYV